MVAPTATPKTTVAPPRKPAAVLNTRFENDITYSAVRWSGETPLVNEKWWGNAAVSGKRRRAFDYYVTVIDDKKVELPFLSERRLSAASSTKGVVSYFSDAMNDLNFDFVGEQANAAEGDDETVGRNPAATRSTEGHAQNPSSVAPIISTAGAIAPTASLADRNQGSFQRPHDQRDDKNMAEIQRERTLSAISQHVILVSKRQEKNPLLKFVRNVRWQFGEIVPDYMLGKDTCALFLSLRYHLLEPEYIHGRIAQLQRNFRVRVLLCHVDVPDVVKPLGEVTKIAIFHDCTLICAWSYKECARYLETFKSYETKPADGIQERVDKDFSSRLTAALTAIKGVNKTDSAMLGATLGSVTHIMKASKEEISACPGIGPTKLQRLHDTFHQPFYFGRGAAQPPTAAGNESKSTAPHEEIPQERPAVEQYPASRKRGRREAVERVQNTVQKTNEGVGGQPVSAKEKEVVRDVGIPLDVEEF